MAKVLILCIACLLFADESAFKLKSLYELRSKDTVRQQYEESCGGAAFATLLGLYGNKVTEKEILKEANSTDMLSLAQLAKIANKYELKANGYKIDHATFERLKIPVIARVEQQENLQHFVVVQNYDGQFIKMYDSNIGAFWIRKDEFYREFDKAGGYILVVAPPKGFVGIDNDASLKPNIVYDGRKVF
jgi:predicted double-glycine peptidase